jgi:maltooligosyltrehalose trehalohydrolase
MKFSLWSPVAKSVELCVGAERHAMRKVAGDYWEADVNVLPGGIRYRYSIDGGPPLPDPTSAWQPDGVHGDSWAGPLPAPPKPLAKSRPLAAAVIYELHVGTFTREGTYAAAHAHLPHLVELGVTHVELMPVATFPGRQGWGYDGTYWLAPHPAYGTPAELVAFVSACHEHGLAVLMDVVYNHFGPDGNYLAVYGSCFAGRKTLWGEALNFDGPDSDGLRQLVLESATVWLRNYGCDGLRLDAVHAISDGRAIHILEELAEHVRGLEKQLQRPLVLIAESDLHDPRLVRLPSSGGYGLHAFWADDFHHAVHGYLTGEHHGYYADFHGLGDIARSIREGYIYQGQYAPSRRRGHGRPPLGIGPDQLVFCIQNHDQVGNRAAGERLSGLLSPEKVKAAAALLLLSPQVPLLFQGEEWAARTPFLYFTDHVDPQLGQAVTEGRRREFPHAEHVADPQDPSTYRRSQLDWRELKAPPGEDMFEWYRRLIALRREIGVAPCDVQFDEAARWLTLDRGSVLAGFNFAETAQEIPKPVGDWRVELASVEGGGGGMVPPGGTVVFRRGGKT